jgi:hypothetical protein
MYLPKLTGNDLSCIITVMHMHSSDLYNRIADARPTVIRLGDAKLHLMLQNCVRYWAQLDGEFVNCRRRNRLTPKYTEIAQKLDEALVVLEQQLVFGSLLKM